MTDLNKTDQAYADRVRWAKAEYALFERCFLEGFSRNIYVSAAPDPESLTRESQEAANELKAKIASIAKEFEVDLLDLVLGPEKTQLPIFLEN